MGRPRKTPIESDQVIQPMKEVNLDEVEAKETEVEVNQGEFASLKEQLDRQSALIQRLMNSQGLQHDPVTGYAEHTDELPQAKILFIDEKPVVSYGTVRNVGDALSIKLTLLKPDGTTEAIEYDYSRMMFDGERFMVEIIKTDRTERSVHQGMIPQVVITTMSDEIKKKTSLGRPYTPRRVTLKQTLVEDIAQVRFLNGPLEGKELKVNVSCLNP